MTSAGLAPEPVRLRRAVLLILVLIVSVLLIRLGHAVLAPGGWTLIKMALLACLVVNAPWLGLSAATGLVGFLIRLTVRDPVTFILPQLSLLRDDQSITLRTAIAVCVRDEDVGAIFARLHHLADEIDSAGLARNFLLCVLSDSSNDAVAEAEARGARQLQAGFGGVTLYRRRTENTGFKAGNVMSFLDEHAGQFELLLCLDADSEMQLSTIRRMVAVMQVDPMLAILQATFHGQPAQRLFTRLFQFGHRHGLRIWATGQGWWQADQGPYWGHNAVIRVAPFRQHCRLQPLPNGELVLSHDHVEAARLQGAGWRLRVLACDSGSSESHPPTLPDYLARDIRWAAGNLQYRHLLGRRDLSVLGRFQMLQAILHYILTPFWFAMLPLAALNGVLGGAVHVPREPLTALLLLGWLALHGPKLLGYTEALLRHSRIVPEYQPSDFLRSAAAEIAYTLLLDPIIALQKTWAVLSLVVGRPVGWSSQVRAEHGVSWTASSKQFWPHTLVGIALMGMFACTSKLACCVGLLFTLGLVLAIPFACLTTRAARA